jgi:SAM-dependent methyltransferase
MPSDLEFTGERFVPGIAGEIAHEHWHRYVFARRHVTGWRVLDVACGEGYGSALLAGFAVDVVGVDIDADAIAHARGQYGSLANLRFAQGFATALPLPDASVDAVVSFETIEHLPAADQPRMLAEIARVLTPNGMLLLSAPNPVEYSQARDYRNPFHMHEPDRAELEALLDVSFPARRWFRQRRYFGSAVWSEMHGGFDRCDVEAWTGEAAHAQAAQPPAAMYFIVIAARSTAALPVAGPALSLYADRGEAELARIDAQAREVMRQDDLLRERDAALDRQAAHVKHLEELAAEHDAALGRQGAHVTHLEELVAYRERIVEERDAQLAAANAEREALADERDGLAGALSSARQAVTAHAAECDRLERALTAQERIIAYRQSMRWWLALPWLRLRLWWQRLRGA